jgi:hypothetical protein
LERRLKKLSKIQGKAGHRDGRFERALACASVPQ